MRLPLWTAIFILLASGSVYATLAGGPSILAYSASKLTPGRTGATLSAATSTPSSLATTTIEAMARELEGVDTGKAAETLAEMDALQAAWVMEQMGTEKGAAAMGNMPGHKASLIMEKMSTDKAVAMMGAMDVTRASDVWSQVEKVKAGTLMERVPAEKAAEIVALVSEERLVPRLPEISPAKLWEMPLQLLMDKLPTVPVMHLDSWNRPPVPVDLPPARPMAAGQDLTEFLLPEARGGQWAEVAGDLPDVDRMWARFTRDLSDVGVKLERLAARPPGVSSLPQSRVVSSFLAVSLENAQPADVSVAAAVVSVEKSWLLANQIHKWSIEFSRFNEDLGTWVPSPSKRIREDSDRVLFAVVVPGFSTLAISGSRALGDQVFRVSDLVVTPESPRAGSDFTVMANVTNTSPLRATYPARLWLNRFIEGAQEVVVEPGQTVPFSFSVNKPEGVYVVRVERLLDEFAVAPASSLALPSTGGPSAGAWSLYLLAGLGAAMVLAGAALARQPR